VIISRNSPFSKTVVNLFLTNYYVSNKREIKKKLTPAFIDVDEYISVDFIEFYFIFLLVMNIYAAE
jgi:hypothetical protein